MASLAEHLSGPLVEVVSDTPIPIIADLAPIGLFCMGLTLLAFSCSVLAYQRLMSARQ